MGTMFKSFGSNINPFKGPNLPFLGSLNPRKVTGDIQRKLTPNIESLGPLNPRSVQMGLRDQDVTKSPSSNMKTFLGS